MRVHLIRHGETELNRKHVHQTAQTDLSEIGIKQVRALQPCFDTLEIDLALSSDLLRAKQTTEIATQGHDITVEYTDMLREIRRPSSVLGHSHFGPKTFNYVLRSLYHRDNKAWHFEDAESIYEIHERAEEFVAYLEKLARKRKNRPKSIAVVSHAVFIEFILIAMCNVDSGPQNLIHYFPVFSPAFRMPNAAITTLFYDDDKKAETRDWTLVRENDVAHLLR